MAVGCYEALKERGEQVGKTIGVMGYDDQEIAQHLNPPLSTVLLPHREMAQWCARNCFRAGDLVAERNRMECPPVLRASHARKLAEGSLAGSSIS
jgi:LacI family transcriptional regulator